MPHPASRSCTGLCTAGRPAEPGAGSGRRTQPRGYSARDHLDHAALVSHPVTRVGLRGGEEMQLLDVADANLAQLIHISSRDTVQVDADLAGALVVDAGHAARVQPGGPEFLDQRHEIDRGRSLELLRLEHVGVAGARPTRLAGAR